jgi:hypothetical protein
MFDPNCHRCIDNAKKTPGRIQMQVYSIEHTYPDGRKLSLIFNVTLAIAFAIQRIVEPIEVPEQVAGEIVLNNLSETFCGRHVEHVDHTMPGLIGTYDQKHFLMDGTHRMFACLKHHRPVKAFVLDENQTRQFLIRESWEEPDGHDNKTAGTGA